MEQPALTFVNTTGASSLSPLAAKRMRAHITKTNFAKRRQTAATKSGPREQFKEARTLEKTPDIIPTVPDPPRDATAFHQLQELVFLEGRHSPGSASEAAWFQLIASDPVLMEASLAVAVRYWSPEGAWQLKASRHSYTAVHLLQERIMATGARTDGVLGAVLTMAFGATLEQDSVAWEIHIDGLAHMIEERKSPAAVHPPPSWLIDLIVQSVMFHAIIPYIWDSVNAIFGFPRLYHGRVLDALMDHDDRRIILLVKALCDSVIHLRKQIDSHHLHPLDPPSVAREIEEPLSQLRYKVRALRTIDDLYVQSTARAIELVLYLLWPSQSSGAHLTLLAGELKEAICRLPIKGCSYMNLTSFPLMIGAVAADEDSLPRRWFVDRLAREVRAVQLRGWKRPFGGLQEKLGGESSGLMGRFDALWRELQGED
ncbi:hypothetical protein FE257_012396 [Aspergillus nanangensis]|uniref:Uncharacterized protein n=1 Tax=Aspergillus nanangensis TaxID=2582783 RepID=A0AAD4CUJ0_ASPNN|nr:hypothetical protein FE257_012396 [Aspergillus nanangensis]